MSESASARKAPPREVWFDKSKSQVTDDALVRFLTGDYPSELTDIPGIGSANAALLSVSCEGDPPVRNAYNLLGRFLDMVVTDDPEVPVPMQFACDAFTNYLSRRGISSHRADIVHCMSEKVAIMLPELVREP